MTANHPEGEQGADPRADALRLAAAARTREAERAAEAGIRALIKDGGQISFRAVARSGGVSTRFLHRHPELSSRIRNLRAQQRGQAEAAHQAVATGESAVIAALRRQLRDETDRNRRREAHLRSEVKGLERQVAALYGRLGTAKRGEV